MTLYTVRNNEDGSEKKFENMDEAQVYCDFLIFTIGIDAEIQ